MFYSFSTTAMMLWSRLSRLISVNSAGTSITSTVPILVKAGTSTGTATVGGVLNVNTTSQATTGLVEEVLATYTLPANVLSANGKGVRITAWADTAANANAKLFRVRIGGIGGTAAVAHTTTASAGSVSAIVTLIRTGAATELSTGPSWSGINGGAAGVILMNHVSHTQDTTATIAIVVTGTTVTAIGDLTFKGLVVEAIN